VVAARILASAFVKEGKSAMAVPKFGAERRGAPVVAYTGFDDKPIREKTQLYNPDCVIVVDPLLMRSIDVFQGAKERCMLLINRPEPPPARDCLGLGVVAYVDATKIGLQELGRPITNVCMLGAFARATQWIKLDSVLASLEEYFKGGILDRNVQCARRGYDETRIAHQ
jgi:2-oxoacid:acceptor oxidoreductase gamma subunit (pyruvate/2-ketoisovalerate family)